MRPLRLPLRVQASVPVDPVLLEPGDPRGQGAGARPHHTHGHVRLHLLTFAISSIAVREIGSSRAPGSFAGCRGLERGARPCPRSRRLGGTGQGCRLIRAHGICADITLLSFVCPPRYTTNTTEFPYNLWLYQKYYDIERIGWGLYPTHTWNNSARPLRANLCVSSFRLLWSLDTPGADSSAFDLSLQPPLFPRLNSPIPLPIPRLTRKRVWLCEHLCRRKWRAGPEQRHGRLRRLCCQPHG